MCLMLSGRRSLATKLRGMVKEKAETEYGENPDFYDGFFVPERARWMYLQDKLGDAIYRCINNATYMLFIRSQITLHLFGILLDAAKR